MNRIPRFHYPTEREIEERRIADQAAAAIAMQAPGAAEFEKKAVKIGQPLTPAFSPRKRDRQLEGRM